MPSPSCSCLPPSQHLRDEDILAYPLLHSLFSLHHPASQTLFKTSLLLQNQPHSSPLEALEEHTSETPTSVDTTNPNAPIEPLPHLDYYTLNLLIRLAHPHISTRQLKRYDYLISARRMYYTLHVKVQFAYNTLLDTYCLGESLQKRIDHLNSLKLSSTIINITTITNANEPSTYLPFTTKEDNELKTLTAQHAHNTAALKAQTKRVKNLIDRRARGTAWFSATKVMFLQSEVPDLVELGRRSWEVATGRAEAEPSGAHEALGGKENNIYDSTNPDICTPQESIGAGPTTLTDHHEAGINPAQVLPPPRPQTQSRISKNRPNKPRPKENAVRETPVVPFLPSTALPRQTGTGIAPVAQMLPL